jgi:hypothetical protein
LSVDWQIGCADDLERAVRDHPYWRGYVANLSPKNNLHLAVFAEPYLSFVLNGKKTVESRFSSVRCAPYESVESGDIILLKQVSGPVVGICRATSATYYELDKARLLDLKHRFSKMICPANEKFWQDRAHASFATLITIADVWQHDPFSVAKRDRRGWVKLANWRESLCLTPQLSF